ncbi:hypothetical protein HDU97_002244 [Phlyctochytrium planicorne]|nr:hypothetical protein HDU97_002244 [Phlyctochytrium planicorne]
MTEKTDLQWAVAAASDEKKTSLSKDDIELTANAGLTSDPSQSTFVVLDQATGQIDAKATDAGEVAEEELPGANLSKLEFILVFVGLGLAVFLAALDQTIVAVALPVIADEFKSLDQIAWIGTAYFLTATSFIPSYGQLADIFGRKPIFLISIFIFEVGSAMCGAAPNMNFLIAARAVAGLGGGGIFSLVIIIISDLVPIRQRANYQGIIGAVFGLASVAGPLLGGAFVDHVNWRWVFYINLPIGVFTVAAVIFCLRIKRQRNRNITKSLLEIDWLGTFLLIVTVVLILIPLQGGGTLYAWNSVTVITLFVLGSLFLVAFIYVEGWVATNPVIPFSLFKNYHVVATFASSMFLGMSFFTLVFYSPLFYQAVQGATATQAGIKIIPLIMGVVFCSIISGVVASSTGIFMPFLPFSGIVIAVGAGLMSTLDETSPVWKQVIFLLIAGIGVGAGIQTVLLSAQASVEPELLAVVTANTNFWQTIGAVLGLAIVSSIFNNKLDQFYAEETAGYDIFVPPGLPPDIYKKSIASVRAILPDVLQAPIIHAYVRTLSLVFLLAVPFAGLLVLASLFIKKERLPSEKREMVMAG